MNIKIIDLNFDQKLFNEKAPHPMQSWQWGEIKRTTGNEILRLGEFNVDNERSRSLQHVYQITFHNIPHTKYKVGYLPRSVFPSIDVLNFLLDYGKQNNVIFIKFEPYVSKKLINNEVMKQWSNVTISPHPLFPDWTIMLDLTKSEEELMKNLKPKTRYNIKLAQKKGVYVKEESTDRGFQIFIDLYMQTCKRQKYFGHDLHYHQTVWSLLKQGIARILIVYYKDTPLAAYELFNFNGVFYYPYGGSSLAYKNFMAPNLLMWEAIGLGKKNGAKKFDLWGSLPPTFEQNHPWSGFTRFKEGYGGEFVQLAGSYDFIISPVLYKLYNLAWKARSFYLQFIS